MAFFMITERQKQLKNFLSKLRISIKSLKLIDQALTHKSYANEILKGFDRNAVPDIHNERLEFLGDAILGMSIARALFKLYPEENEGALTHRKAQVVCEATLYEIGMQLSIGEYILLGKGERDSGGAERTSTIANTVEAVLGAIFESDGFEVTEKLILRLWDPYLSEKKIASASIDHKSRLQEYLLAKRKTRPSYKILKEAGPEHAKEYTVGLFINGKKESQGTGQNKKKAEQNAAEIFLKENNIHL